MCVYVFINTGKRALTKPSLSKLIVTILIQYNIKKSISGDVCITVFLDNGQKVQFFFLVGYLNGSDLSLKIRQVGGGMVLEWYYDKTTSSGG